MTIMINETYSKLFVLFGMFILTFILFIPMDFVYATTYSSTYLHPNEIIFSNGGAIKAENNSIKIINKRVDISGIYLSETFDKFSNQQTRDDAFSISQLTTLNDGTTLTCNMGTIDGYNLCNDNDWALVAGQDFPRTFLLFSGTKIVSVTTDNQRLIIAPLYLQGDQYGGNTWLGKHGSSQPAMYVLANYVNSSTPIQNVGIHTTDPRVTLHVVGNLHVNGHLKGKLFVMDSHQTDASNGAINSSQWHSIKRHPFEIKYVSHNIMATGMLTLGHVSGGRAQALMKLVLTSTDPGSTFVAVESAVSTYTFEGGLNRAASLTASIVQELSSGNYQIEILSRTNNGTSSLSGGDNATISIIGIMQSTMSNAVLPPVAIPPYAFPPLSANLPGPSSTTST